MIVPCSRRTKHKHSPSETQRDRNSGTYGEVGADVQHALNVGVEVDEQRELCDVWVVDAEHTCRNDSIRHRAVHPACDAEVSASRRGGVIRREDRAGQGVAEELLRAVRVPDKLGRSFAVIYIPLPRCKVRVDLAKLCSRPLEQHHMWGIRQAFTKRRVRDPSLP